MGRMIAALSVLSAPFALLSATTPALAEQASCGPRAQLLGYLSNKFSERPVALGVTSDGNLLEVAASGDGTWTILVTRPTGTTCAIAAGERWSRLGVSGFSEEEGDL